MSWFYRHFRKTTDEATINVLTADVTVDAGDVVVTAGDFTVTAGDAVVTAGDATITAGNLAVTAGSATVGTYVSAGSYVDAASYVEFGASGARLYTGLVTPTSPGYDAPNGSMYMWITTAAATGYLKTSTATTGWSSINVT
jgi:hypothetical protein